MKVSKCSVFLLVLGITGVIFLVLGCILIHVFTDMIHDKIAENIPLKNGSQSFKMWSDPSSPIYFQVWMFDVINVEEILTKGDKPYVNQIGPYTYREERHKFNISYNANGTINYRERRSYIFQRNMSSGPESDTFMTVNLPMLTIATLTRWEFPRLKKVIQYLFSLSGERLFMNLTVHDLMWGYPDNLLSTINKGIKELGLNFTLPDMFGLFYNKNNTDDGAYQIYSGLDGLKNFGEIVTWNEERILNYWTSNISNMINGSDGTIYPPFVDSDEMKYLFSSDLCRSLGLKYSETVTVRDIDMYKFVAPDIMMANVTVNPYNAGFCTPPGNCLPSGLLNVSSCRSGAPVVMSMPHFLGCDDQTVNAVYNLHPDRNEHESYVDIEPRTGVAMNVGKKLQINVFIEPIQEYTDTLKIQPIVFPIMWLNESAMISDSDAADFKSQVLDKIVLTKAIQYAIIGLGGLFILIVIVALIVLKLKPAKGSTKINDDDDEPMLIPANN